MLTFDTEQHQYFWHGVLVPNVTRVIAHLTDYSHIKPDMLKCAQDEGIAIHAMVDLDCKNDLVLPVPEWMTGRYKAWCRFKEETGFECWGSEFRMFDMLLGVAGTLDIVGVLHNLKKIRGGAIIDVKRSLYAGPAIGLQTAGYERLWSSDKTRDKTRHRFALELRDNETYRLTPCEDADDAVAFLACVQQLKWKEKHYVRSN